MPFALYMLMLVLVIAAAGLTVAAFALAGPGGAVAALPVFLIAAAALYLARR